MIAGEQIVGDDIVYIREKNGKKMEFNFVLSTEEFPEWKQLAEFVQSEYSSVGINDFERLEPPASSPTEGVSLTVFSSHAASAGPKDYGRASIVLRRDTIAWAPVIISVTTSAIGLIS